LALLFGEESRLPVYYRKLPGNVTDVMTIHKMLADIDFLDLEKVNLVMDRGFYSEENINALYGKHYKFLMGARTSLKFVQHKLDEIRDSMNSRASYSSIHGLNYHSSTEIWHYKEVKKRSGIVNAAERRMYLHLFFNAQRAADDKTDFNALLDGLENELLSDKLIPAHEALYEKYFEVKRTPKRGIALSYKEDAIKKAEKNYGYFALISNEVRDPLEALQIYRSKDVVEKAFGNLKERLNMRRTSVSSEQNLEGKLFVQFVALIFLSFIDKAMRENSLYKNYTMQELFDELDIIESFEQPGRGRHIGEMTKRQLELYKVFGVEAPA
jgi:transposase